MLIQRHTPHLTRHASHITRHTALTRLNGVTAHRFPRTIMPTHITRGSPLLLPPSSPVILRTRTQQVCFLNGKIVTTESVDPHSPHTIIITCHRCADGDADICSNDAADALIVPGYIDWQINGCYGIDFSADDSGASLTQGVAAAAKLLPRHGVTAFCPTVVTCPPDVYARSLPHFSPAPGGGSAGAHVIGLHLEGPVLSPSKAGAHRPQLLRAPAAGSTFEDVYGGVSPDGVAVVTLSCEVDEGDEFTRHLRGRGVQVSLGHCNASFERASTASECRPPPLPALPCDFVRHFDAAAAVAAGAAAVTHMFNCCSSLSNRNPGCARTAPPTFNTAFRFNSCVSDTPACCRRHSLAPSASSPTASTHAPPSTPVFLATSPPPPQHFCNTSLSFVTLNIFVTLTFL